MKLYFLIALLIQYSISPCQSDFLHERYQNSFQQLDSLLETKNENQFKKAVFITENTFLNNQINYEKYDRYIQDLISLAKDWMSVNQLDYKYSDSMQVLKNFAIYKVLKDTIRLHTPLHEEIAHVPYLYDFDDFSGNSDWKNMFVTKLLAIHSGNCHNLPYLYKILADELGAPCWLSLAPNHMYIQNHCKKSGWYNTELTSGDFPIDAWIMASGYLSLKAVQSGIYMDTLSNKQAIALCVLDLAKGYEHQTQNYYDSLIIKCCNLSLKYFPLNVQAMLLKAETLKRVYEKKSKERNTNSKNYQEMEALYVKLFDLGYREMPDKMYIQWLQSVTKERDRYSNKQIKATLLGK